MKTLAAFLALLVAGCSEPAAIGPAFAVATGADGATVSLHEDAGPCVGEARLAVYRRADGSGKVLGCWLLGPDGVAVSFLDGERGNIPAGHLRKVSAT